MQTLRKHKQPFSKHKHYLHRLGRLPPVRSVSRSGAAVGACDTWQRVQQNLNTSRADRLTCPAPAAAPSR